MNKLYLIASGEAIPRKELTSFLESIPECSNWFYSIPNVTFAFATLSADELFEKIRGRFPGDIRVFITEVPMDNCQGWIPKKHWDLVHANDIVHNYDLKFEGYWVAEHERFLPAYSGIYCVYSCRYNSVDDAVALKKLLYIGRAENIKERHKAHEKLDEWKSCLSVGETLCYSCASLDARSLVICEAAMIFHHQPICNDIGKDAFWHEKTHVKTSGCNRFLKPEFVVVKSRA